MAGEEYHRYESGLSAHDLRGSEIPACLGWVLFAVIIEEGLGGGSVYRAIIGRDCQLLGCALQHSHRRRSTMLADWLGIVVQRYRTMTFVGVVCY